MNAYQEEIEKRGITRLCHFTKSSNLPFILGDGKVERNGILSTKYIRGSDYLEELDKKRLDGHIENVCCTVQNPNRKYFLSRQFRGENDLFHQWTVIYIDPSIINDTSEFSPVNAAAANGANLQSGIAAFKELFADPISYIQGGAYHHEFRDMGLADNETTDEQAEVQIKDYIPKEYIIGVAFPEATFKLEKQRLKFCLSDADFSRIDFEVLPDEYVVH